MDSTPDPTLSVHPGMHPQATRPPRRARPPLHPPFHREAGILPGVRRWLSLLLLALLALLALSGCASPGGGEPEVGLAADGDPEVVLNVPAQELTLYLGGRRAATYRVTVGSPGHPTPVGDFTLQRAIWNPWWHPPERGWAQRSEPQPPGPDNAMGRVKIYFKPLYFLHGTADTEDLGEPASHGCVRLSNRDVVELARRLHRYATPDLEPAVLEALEADAEENREIAFDRPVPLRIVYELVEIDGDRLVVHPDVYRRVGPEALVRRAEEVLAEHGRPASPERLSVLVAGLHQDGGSVELDRLVTGGG